MPPTTPAAGSSPPTDRVRLELGLDHEDSEALGTAMVAPAGIAELVGPEREAAVCEGIVAALEPYRRDDGSYRPSNEFRFLVARA